MKWPEFHGCNTVCDNKKCNDNFITFELGRPEQQFRKALCFSRDVFFNSPQDLRAASADRHETLSLDWYLAEFYNARPKIRGPPPKKNLGLKHAKFGSILHNIRLWSRISLEQVNISKFGTRKSGELRSTIQKVDMCLEFGPIPNRLFQKTIFQPIGSAGTQNFLLPLQKSPRLASTHHNRGQDSQKKFKGEYL